MPLIIGLDSNVLGILVHPSSPNRDPCNLWLEAQSRHGNRIAVPEIADYELRRELLLVNSLRALHNLDRLARRADYIPLTTSALRKAAELWASLRRGGQPTADRHALDADVILAAQLLDWVPNGWSLVVASTNVKHLSRLVDTRPWQQI